MDENEHFHEKFFSTLLEGSEVDNLKRSQINKIFSILCSVLVADRSFLSEFSQTTGYGRKIATFERDRVIMNWFAQAREDAPEIRFTLTLEERMAYRHEYRQYCWVQERTTFHPAADQLPRQFVSLVREDAPEVLYKVMLILGCGLSTQALSKLVELANQGSTKLHWSVGQWMQGT